MTTEPQAFSSQPSNLYEADFYAWTQQQAKLLQAGTWQNLDTANLVEEIELLGKQQRQELVNRLGVLPGHLLKWNFQPGSRSKSWFATIREQRRRVNRLLQQNSSLKPYLSEALSEAYPDGIDLVVREIPLSYKDLPQDCPYGWEQILDAAFLPGQRTEIEQEWMD